jgi:hypothetical protein
MDMMENVVIGKRVQIGAVFTSLAGLLTHFYPEHGAAFIAAAVPLTFIAQIAWARKFGVTLK